MIQIVCYEKYCNHLQDKAAIIYEKPDLLLLT